MRYPEGEGVGHCPSGVQWCGCYHAFRGASIGRFPVVAVQTMAKIDANMFQNLGTDPAAVQYDGSIDHDKYTAFPRMPISKSFFGGWKG